MQNSVNHAVKNYNNSMFDTIMLIKDTIVKVYKTFFLYNYITYLSYNMNIQKGNNMNKQKIMMLFSGLSIAGNVLAFQPHSLTISENFKNPIGFYDNNPTFSWQLSKEIKLQKSYQIQVFDKDSNEKIWDSNLINSEQSAFIQYTGKKFNSRQQLLWRVRIKNNKNKLSDWSNFASFELGLLKNSDWQAKWIRNKYIAENNKIEIIKAIYGSLDNTENQIDVTHKISSFVKNKKYHFKVNNKLFPEDPAPKKTKYLVVEYILNDKKITKKIIKNKTISLIKQPVFKCEYFRKKFITKKEIKQARLYITAKGLFTAYINGEKIGNDYLTPNWTPYAKRIDTLSYDITNNLKNGDNIINATLAEG